MAVQQMEAWLSQMALFCFIITVAFGVPVMKRIMVPGGGR